MSQRAVTITTQISVNMVDSQQMRRMLLTNLTKYMPLTRRNQDNRTLERCNFISLLLYLSVSAGTVSGQFCGLYSTELYRPLNFKVPFPARPINLTDVINILLTSFSQSVL